ncbi:GTPase binding protein Rid1 [Diplocarpon rosae]|nr:GTPase binding protein Rid1 [Diplocarpon rosae]
MASQYPQSDSYHHKRAKSSVLSGLSFIHKRNPSAGATLPPRTASEFTASPVYESVPFLPLDHPHSRALGEIHQNQQSQLPLSQKKSREAKRPNTTEEGPKLHKKTLSSISLKSLAGKDTDKATKSKEPKSNKPKKTKSTTNLAALLTRPKSSRSLHKESQAEARVQKDKENRNPVTSSPVESAPPPPIYAQFSSQYFTKQPLGGKFLEDEIDLYTPENYSPGKQRNFYEGHGQQPTLTKRDEGLERPRMPYLPSSFSVQDISRKVSNRSRKSAELIRRVSGGRRPSLDRRTTGSSTRSGGSETAGPSKGQRVLAAVSALGGGRPQKSEAMSDVVLHDKDIDREFEAMLDRRNIPEHQRGKMRNLAMPMKKDFVRQDWAEIAAAKNGRPGTNGSDSSADAANAAQVVPEVKAKRPRSRAFTLSRGNSKEPSPNKKQNKTEGSLGNHPRTKSTDISLAGAKSLTATGVAAAQSMIAKAKGQSPDDFVSYLRKVQKPELVEVGRLHKLRLLLRNETVAWTDEFIVQGGMGEIVGLLHRTMEVEWREEHEDTLLHEVLLCLKALSTTALALHHLEAVNVTKEVFWIFLHNLNVVALPGARHHDSETMYETSNSTIASLMSNSSFDSSNPHHLYMARYFPPELPPVPAAPYVGGVEWDATNYLASHLDLVNGIISCLPTQSERNALREQMLVSGWEKCFGGTLRLCKEKFYGGVHAGLRCWVAAAVDDGWDTRDVRCGPAVEPRSPAKSPKKMVGPSEPAPKIEMKLDFSGTEKKPVSNDIWL